MSRGRSGWLVSGRMPRRLKLPNLDVPEECEQRAPVTLQIFRSPFASRWITGFQHKPPEEPFRILINSPDGIFLSMWFPKGNLFIWSSVNFQEKWVTVIHDKISGMLPHQFNDSNPRNSFFSFLVRSMV